MKTDIKKYEVESEGIEAQGFTVDLTAHTFEILSKNIYSDVPRAIIRELICNGVDACVKARSKDPVEVYLPTDGQRSIVIEDFGCGMTKSEVLNVYTRYFSSTKRETNKAIGMLGLGCKTPFAYTDQYTVSSSKNGKKNSFVIFRDESGLPMVSHLMTEDTTGHGTRVEIPIKAGDEDKFYKAYIQTVIFMNELPTIRRGHDEVENRLHQLSNNQASIQSLWKFVKDSGKEVYTRGFYSDSLGSVINSISQNPIGVLMGGVYYYVDLPQLMKDGESEVQFKYPANSYKTFKTIKIDIGDVDIQPSREALNYSQKTIDCLRTKLLNGLMNEMGKFKKITKNNVREVVKDVDFSNFFSVVGAEESLKNDLIKNSVEEVNKVLVKVGEDYFAKRRFVYTVDNNGDKKTTWNKVWSGNRTEKDYLEVGKSVVTRLLSKSFSTIVVMPDDKTATLEDKRVENGFPGHYKTRIDIANGGVAMKDYLVCNENSLDYLTKHFPDLGIVYFDKIKAPKSSEPRVQGERPDRSGEVGLYTGDSWIDVDDAVEKLRTGQLDRIVYEVFSGSSESDSKSCWLEYVHLNALEGDKIKKTEVLDELYVARGFMTQRSLYKDLEREVQKKIPSISLFDSDSLFVSVRYSSFVQNRLWEKKGFVQIGDYMKSKIDGAVIEIEKYVTSLHGKDKHHYDAIQAKWIKDNFGNDATFQKTKFFKEVEKMVSNNATLDDWELKSLSNNVRAPFTGFGSIYKVFPEELKIDIKKVDDALNGINSVKGTDYTKSEEWMTDDYPMIKWTRHEGREYGLWEDLIKYVASIEGVI